MRPALFFGLLLLLIGAPMRTAAASDPAQGPLVAARAEVEAARAEHGRLRAEQLTLSRQVGALSQEITALKAEGGRGHAGRLDAALKESQALSARLGQVSRHEVSARSRLESAQTSLVQRIGEAMEPLQRQLERAEPLRRRELLASLQRLRAEADFLRSALGPTTLALLPPLPELPPAHTAPERLLARVDVLRDQEDRLRARLVEVRQRLKLARTEARLARGMDDFLSRRSLFDESDRRLAGTGVRAGSPQTGTAPEYTVGDDPMEFGSQAPGWSDPGTGGIEAAAITDRPAGRSGRDDAQSVEALEALEKEMEARARELAAQARALEVQLERLR